MMKSTFFICFSMLSLTFFGQELSINMELKPRFEYRHGFKTLVPDSLKAATFVSQRSRLNINYKSTKLTALLSIQNVRVWGDVSTLSSSDANGTAIHQAWASFLLDSLFSLKIGRQEIVYDDSRIFGNVDWAQTGRSHDAFIASYHPNTKTRLDIGLVLNEEDETLFKTEYEVNNYKAFQYLWLHRNFGNFSGSILGLNTGFAFDSNGKQKVDYNQTFGGFATFKKGKINADASLYFQTGKIAGRSLDAFNLASNLHYDISPVLNVGIGAEYLTGTDMDSNSDRLKSFNPLFGTNHKFNGWMDYFYVGNHINSVGLLDICVPMKYQKGKWNLQFIPHAFSSAANVVDAFGNEQNPYLGTELDVMLNYEIEDNINFQMGYSHMFATDTMEILKGGNRENITNWAWAMFVFKPRLFDSSFHKN
ncbi:MAG: alginate export family protein [Gelidibacter sp.]